MADTGQNREEQVYQEIQTGHATNMATVFHQGNKGGHVLRTTSSTPIRYEGGIPSSSKEGCAIVVHMGEGFIVSSSFTTISTS